MAPITAIFVHYVNSCGAAAQVLTPMAWRAAMKPNVIAGPIVAPAAGYDGPITEAAVLPMA